ncbi:hypothetical protein AB0J86_16425 [Micromonospora sp. NPDC049559]|uniref:hypothetical protein n=1 Tax=Micromonospora sp. NPDC049559 TaxID=3155923 RepID=UPI0034465B9C
MRWLRLYLRSRRVPLALGLATAATALVWALWLAYSDERTVNARLVSLTVMLAVAAFTPTLGGADDALDRTASVNWPVRRAAHLLLTASAITGLLLLSTVTDARFAPLTVVLRDTVGILGLTALGAALLGPARSWIAPLTWTLVTILPFVGPSTKLRWQVAGWLVQPAGSTAATVFAALLAVAGLVAYALRGLPRHPAVETAPDH